jgi:hypothetical protein
MIRREPEEMPASSWEIDDAEHEGVKIENRWGVKQVLAATARQRIELRKVERVFDEQHVSPTPLTITTTRTRT